MSIKNIKGKTIMLSFNCEIKEELKGNWETGEESLRFIMEPIDGFKINFDERIEAVSLVILLGEIKRILEGK